MPAPRLAILASGRLAVLSGSLGSWRRQRRQRFNDPTPARARPPPRITCLGCPRPFIASISPLMIEDLACCCAVAFTLRLTR
eukprot:4701210-Alexandrium_andersonii.AAC.1